MTILCVSFSMGRSAVAAAAAEHQQPLLLAHPAHKKIRRQQQCLWRQEDVEQRHLDNARVLWGRAMERNRRDVEEKSEQLKAISTLAALIAGFALSAFLQFDFGSYQDTTGFALPIFGVSMALTVGTGGGRNGIGCLWGCSAGCVFVCGVAGALKGGLGLNRLAADSLCACGPVPHL